MINQHRARLNRIIGYDTRNSFLLWGGLLLLILAATWKLTLADRIIARGDLLLYFYPLRDYASAAIREGRLPLWNPYTFMGAPFLANSQVGFFYPLNIITAWVPVAHAVSWNIVVHLAIATVGMGMLARRGLGLSSLASFVSALIFGLGGYLGSQVEHLNQLQVLAWLPLEVLLIWKGVSVRRTVWLAFLIALQVLAGHTQSLYISVMTLGMIVTIQILAATVQRSKLQHGPPSPQQATRVGSTRSAWRLIIPVAALACAGILAALMTAVQLVPTAELATQSARSGGLPYNEVGSFSWRPWVIARALFPTYGDPLFPEYVAYLGIGGLSLALLGFLTGLPLPWFKAEHAPTNGIHITHNHIIATVLTIAGLILALGVVTPLFGLLYRFLPGFNLFRAQARWLAVFALGTAMLVGLGIQALQTGPTRRQKRYWLVAWLGLLTLLVAGLWAGSHISPEPEYRALPAPPILMGWIIASIGITGLIVLVNVDHARPRPILTGVTPARLFALMGTLELMVASQFQPYARASDDGALDDLRPATAHLLAEKRLQTEDDSARILALSGLFFDPGDLPEQTLIYQSQLSADELYDRVIASKQKEILSPNLSLYYRLPSVDGYDGGLLPLKRYADIVQQFTAGEGDITAKGPHTVDGRLREFLNGVPENAWLERMGIKYVITDKTHDVFIDNIYYDLQFNELLSTTFTLPLESFESTALGLVLSAPGAHSNELLLQAAVKFDDGTSRVFDVRAPEAVTQPYFNIRLRWDTRRTPLEITLTSTASQFVLLGLTSIDEGISAFRSQPIRGAHDMRLVYSGDVKIYENQRPAPHALLVTLADCSTLNGELQTGAQAMEQQAGTVRTVTNSAERLTLEVLADVPAWLILRDACYPGWVARIDGAEVPITCADTLFRAVQVPPGTHTIIFSYEPQSLQAGMGLSGAGLAIWLLLLGYPTLFGVGQRHPADRRRRS